MRASPADSDLVLFRDVPKLPRKILPRRRNDRPLAYQTLWRWWKVGVRGIHLKTYVIGARPATTINDLLAFFEAVGRTSHMADSETPHRSAAKAGKELEAMGV